jgi:MFS family permease
MDVAQATSEEEASRWLTWSSFVDTGSVIISTVAAGYLADGRMGRRSFVYLSTCLYVAAFVLTPQIMPRGVVFFLAVPTLMFGVAHGIQKSVDFAILVDVVGRHPGEIGTYVGVWITAGSIGSTVGSYSFGPLLDLFECHNTSCAVIHHNVSNTTTAVVHTRLGYVVTYSMVASACMLLSALAVWSIADDRIHSGVRQRFGAADHIATTTTPEGESENTYVYSSGDTVTDAESNVPPAATTTRLVITGGFFDGTADGFIGVIEVTWSANPTTNDRARVTSMMMESIQIVRPPSATELAVANKGLGGACWYEGQLWSCFPNQVVVFKPHPSGSRSNWKLTQTIDDEWFNDLHHLCVGAFGVLIANTGFETVDLFTQAGVKQSRALMISENLQRKRVRDAAATGQDFRVYDTKRIMPHVQHVNHVAVIESPRRDGERDTFEVYATTFGNPEESEPSKRNGGLVRVHFEAGHTAGTTVRVADIDGFVHDGEIIGSPGSANASGPGIDPAIELLLQDGEEGDGSTGGKIAWMTTLVGELLAIEINSCGAKTQLRRKWNLYDRDGCAKGWTRGLCLGPSGVFVGTTAIRPGTNAEVFVEWPWDVRDSRTAVTYVPFDETIAPVSLEIAIPERFKLSKIFSILPFPERACSGETTEYKT